MNFKIETTKEVDYKEWNNLIEKSSNSTVFHTLEWMNVMKRTNKKISPLYIIARDGNGEICGGLQLFNHAIVNGIYCLETPYWGNPILIDEDNEDIRRMILKRLGKFGKKPNIARIFLGDFYNTCSYLNQLGFKKENFFTYVLELKISFDWMWKNRFDRNARRNIMKAQKNDIKIEKITNLSQVEQYYQISKHTHMRLDNEVRYSLDFYKNVYEIMGRKRRIYWHLAKKNDIVMAGALHFLHKDTIFNFLSATYSQYFKYSPNRLLISSAIKWGLDNGYKYYNLGGNPQKAKGLNKFKESWGAVKKDYAIYTYERNLYKFNKKIAETKKRLNAKHVEVEKP